MASEEMEQLAAEIRGVLPQLTGSEMNMLMKFLGDNGVRSKYDMYKLEAVYLSGTLTSADAEKLVDFFKNAGERTRATPSSRSEEMEQVVAEIREVLPGIEERRIDMLMKDFTRIGVHCRNDMLKVEPVDLVNTLATDNAKKLVAHFKTTWSRGMFPEYDTAKFMKEEFNQVKVTYEDLNGKLNEEKAQRLHIHEETLRDIGDNVRRIDEMCEATVKNMQETQMQAAKAHEERIRKMEEEDRARAERYAKMESERKEDEKKWLEGNYPVPGTSHEGNAGYVRDTTLGHQDAARQLTNESTLPEVIQYGLTFGKSHAARLKESEETRTRQSQATDEAIRKIKEDERKRAERRANRRREEEEEERRRMERKSLNEVQSMTRRLKAAVRNVGALFTGNTPAADTSEGFTAPHTTTYGNACPTQGLSFPGTQNRGIENPRTTEGSEFQSSQTGPGKRAPSFQD